uniref:DUF5082 domain-containing protein n=1 Tax=Ascaris lumbricoides TaxID=6252 RepID=A0A0M3I9U4_ASCLU
MIEGKEVWNKLRIRYEIDNIFGEIDRTSENLQRNIEENR